jgi:DNA polymerase-3 subunit gamma/tau
MNLNMTQRYQVIARRWRPKQFDELVGQEHVVRTLRNAMRMGRIAHAYLFVGPRGTGKTSTARLFAKALNTEGNEKLNDAQREALAQSIMAGSCMDVIEIDGASNNSVEQVRALREDCQYAPTQCKYKIYIIDEVHMLSTAAFNALLKTLEEPPAHVVFIFATTESHKVLPTIVSRCQRFEFRPISEKVIAGKLKIIAEAEGIEVDEAALYAIARLANGGMRDSQSILDQLISFCGNKISEENILDVYGLASRKSLEAMAKSMSRGDYAGATQAIERWVEEGRDLYRVLMDLQTLVREGFLQAARSAERQSDFLGTMMSAESLFRMLDALQTGESTLRDGLSETVNFEIAIFRAIEQSRTKAIDTVIKKLTQVASSLPQEEQIQKKNHSVAVSNVEVSEVAAPKNTVSVVDAKSVVNVTEDRMDNDADLAALAASEAMMENARVSDLGNVREMNTVAEEMTAIKSAVRVHVPEVVNQSGGENFGNGKSHIENGKPQVQIKTGERKGAKEVELNKGPEFNKAVDAIPESTRQILEGEFRAQFKGLRKVDPKQLI